VHITSSEQRASIEFVRGDITRSTERGVEAALSGNPGLKLVASRRHTVTQSSVEKTFDFVLKIPGQNEFATKVSLWLGLTFDQAMKLVANQLLPIAGIKNFNTEKWDIPNPFNLRSLTLRDKVSKCYVGQVTSMSYFKAADAETYDYVFQLTNGAMDSEGMRFESSPPTYVESVYHSCGRKTGIAPVPFHALESEAVALARIDKEVALAKEATKQAEASVKLAEEATKQLMAREATKQAQIKASMKLALQGVNQSEISGAGNELLKST